MKPGYKHFYKHTVRMNKAQLAAQLFKKKSNRKSSSIKYSRGKSEGPAYAQQATSHLLISQNCINKNRYMQLFVLHSF
jgi:hypothetical protein